MAAFAWTCAADTGAVAFKDASKLKSWDAWNEHDDPNARGEKPCVTWDRLNRLDPGMKEVGRLAVRDARDIDARRLTATTAIGMPTRSFLARLAQSTGVCSPGGRRPSK